MTNIDELIRDCWGTLGVIAMGLREELLLPQGYYMRAIWSKTSYPGLQIYDGDPESDYIQATILIAIYFYAEYIHFACWKHLPGLIDGIAGPHYTQMEYADPRSFEKIQQLVTACCK